MRFALPVIFRPNSFGELRGIPAFRNRGTESLPILSSDLLGISSKLQIPKAVRGWPGPSSHLTIASNRKPLGALLFSDFTGLSQISEPLEAICVASR